MYGWDSVSHAVAYTKNKVDLTNISRIKFVFSYVGKQNNGTIQCFVGSDPYYNPWVGGAVKAVGVNNAGTYTLDVSAINGSYYIGIALVSSTGSGGSANITQVIGE